MQVPVSWVPVSPGSLFHPGPCFVGPCFTRVPVSWVPVSRGQARACVGRPVGRPGEMRGAPCGAPPGMLTYTPTSRIFIVKYGLLNIC